MQRVIKKGNTALLQYLARSDYRRVDVMRQYKFFVFSILILFSLISCSKGSKIDIALEARSMPDGKPVSQAKVIIDGKEEGITDSSGKYTGQIIRKPG